MDQLTALFRRVREFLARVRAHVTADERAQIDLLLSHFERSAWLAAIREAWTLAGDLHVSQPELRAELFALYADLERVLAHAHWGRRFPSDGDWE